MGEPKDVEALHREASSHYLKGDLEEALRIWREILAQRPADVRAGEGVRLCEQLQGAVDGDTFASSMGRESAPAESDSPAAVPAAAAPSPTEPPARPEWAAEPVDDLLQELDDRIALNHGEENAKADGTPSGMWSWDAGDRGTESAAAEPTPEPAVPQQPPKTPAAPQTDDVAAVELRRRVNELLAESLGFMESGDTDGALRTLDRVLILDEENEVALSLRDKIRLEAETHAFSIDEEQPPAPDADPPGREPDTEDLPPLDLALDLSEPDPDLATEPMLADAAREPDPLIAPDGDFSFDDEPGPLPEAPEADADSDTEPPPPRGSRRRSLPLFIAAGIVLAAAAGFVGYRMSTSGEAAASPPSTVEPGSRGPRAPRPASGTSTDDGDARHPVAPSDEARFAAFLADARAAVESRDFAAAVVASNAALELRPDNAEAKEVFDVAAEAYREQQEYEGQWNEAVGAFRNGDYQEALRFFYRVPDGDDRERIDGFKVNGWYNLGVVALRARNCDAAATSLDEARGLRPDDDGVLTALTLAQRCRRQGRASLTRDEIEALPLRGLED